MLGSFKLLLACLMAGLANGSFPSSFGGCPDHPSPTALPQPLPATLQQALDDADTAARLIQSKGIPPVDTGLWTTPTTSISVGVVYDQDLIWHQGYGLCNLSDPASTPTENTTYRIGSISKIFAMLSLMVTRDAGKVNLDDLVSKHVPEFSVKPPPGKGGSSHRGVTLRQLATHLAGLSRETPCSGDPDGGKGGCDMSMATAFERIANTTAILPTDVLPVYSNMGFDILGQALAIVNGLSYEEMVEKLVLSPLGLEHTGVNISNWDLSQMALPYNEGDPPQLCDVCLNDFGWSNPSGAMYSSVADLAKIIHLMFRDDVEAGKTPEQILDGATIRETLLPRFITSDRAGGYALTWELYPIDDYWVRTKRGDVAGYASEMIMVPELKLGIVVLASMVEHAQATAQVLSGILIPAFDAYFRNSAPPRPSPPIPLSSFVGTYRPTNGPEGGSMQTLHVTLDPKGSLLFDWGRSVLVYAGSDAESVMFRMATWPGRGFGGAAPTCTKTQSDDWLELVKFTVKDGQAVHLTLDIAYPWIWLRASK